MASPSAPGAKKLLHSSKLMQMKFMQRGVQRKQMQEQSEKQVGCAPQQKEHLWATPDSPGTPASRDWSSCAVRSH